MTELLFSLIVFAVVATVTPGGANLLAAASGARFGWQRSLPLLTGIAIGLALLVAATAAGLAALLQSAPALQLAMRIAGSAYLVWLAWRIGRSGAPDIASGSSVSPSGFLAGLVLPFLNPKAWSMALAAAAAYAGLTVDPLRLALLLAAAFGLAALPALSLWCAGGSLLARTLRTEPQWRAVNATLGLLLAASIVPMWL
ncbi:Threonine/homoserine/homoserine lactone efflux protein [Rhizobiales bacterium GAS191]|nr:Threonine/homoserine/homoserine lactone efflux protein [Rhizobiales bacterium GAS191]